MGSALARDNNLGTIYSKNGNGTGTYLDIAGVTQEIGTLTTAYTEQVTVPLGAVDYSHPWVGARDAISMSVDIALSTATSIQLKLQGRYDASAAWADIQLVRQDTGVVGSVVNFVAPGTYLVQTASILAVSQIRVVAKSPDAADEDDNIVVRAWVQ